MGLGCCEWVVVVVVVVECGVGWVGWNIGVLVMLALVSLDTEKKFRALVIGDALRGWWFRVVASLACLVEEVRGCLPDSYVLM